MSCDYLLVSNYVYFNQQQQQHPFNGPLSGPTRMSWYQKGKTNLDLLSQETVNGSGISWVICESADTMRSMPAPHHFVFTGLIPLLLPN